MVRRLLLMMALGLALPAAADPMLADFAYPWPVQRHSLVSQN